MARQLKTFMVTTHGNPELIALVGQAPHIVQIRAYANATTKKAFAQLLLDNGLGRKDVATTLRDLATQGSEPKFIPDLTPGVVYVAGLNQYGVANMHPLPRRD